VKKDYEMEIKVVDRVKIYNKDKADDFLNQEIGLYESEVVEKKKYLILKLIPTT
jgi:hypothetical protein